MKHTIFIFSLLILLVTSSITFRAEAEAPERKMTLNESVVYHATLAGVDPNLAYSMMMCESQGKQGAKGDGNRATGIFQFWNDTWKRHSLKYFGEVLDINSPEDQVKVATAAIAGGDGREWTSFRALKNGGSYTFYYKLEKRMITVKCSMIKPA